MLKTVFINLHVFTDGNTALWGALISTELIKCISTNMSGVEISQIIWDWSRNSHLFKLLLRGIVHAVLCPFGSKRKTKSRESTLIYFLLSILHSLILLIKTPVLLKLIMGHLKEWVVINRSPIHGSYSLWPFHPHFLSSEQPFSKSRCDLILENNRNREYHRKDGKKMLFQTHCSWICLSLFPTLNCVYLIE